MIDKNSIALFGYGKTTKAIAKLLGNSCTFFDDNTKELRVDDQNNKIIPSKEYNPNNFMLEVATPSMHPSSHLVKSAKNLISEYDLILGNYLNQEKKPLNIWISGTNGKTTTTQMLTHLLKSKGAQSGGNIGTPLAELNPQAPIWVLETSSFTLHHTKEARADIYLLLPITPDHLDWHGSKESYIADKLKPLNSMQEGQLALIPKGLNPPTSSAWIVEYESSEDLAKIFDIDNSKIKFKGAFLLDSLFALIATKALFNKIEYNLINSFTVDAHRQEELIDKHKRVWVNDSKATNIDATIQVLELYKDKKIHLILGGDDKGVDLSELFNYLKNLNIILYSIGSNSKKIVDLSSKLNIEVKECKELDNAIEEISIQHNRESVAILAPAAASLDQFRSYLQRGNQFKSKLLSL